MEPSVMEVMELTIQDSHHTHSILITNTLGNYFTEKFSIFQVGKTDDRKLLSDLNFLAIHTLKSGTVTARPPQIFPMK